MIADILIVASTLGVILAGAMTFTNGIEWFGRKLNVTEGAVGSVLAAVGTAMPETLIPSVALVTSTGSDGRPAHLQSSSLEPDDYIPVNRLRRATPSAASLRGLRAESI